MIELDVVRSELAECGGLVKSILGDVGHRKVQSVEHRSYPNDFTQQQQIKIQLH